MSHNAADYLMLRIPIINLRHIIRTVTMSLQVIATLPNPALQPAKFLVFLFHSCSEIQPSRPFFKQSFILYILFPLCKCTYPLIPNI